MESSGINNHSNQGNNNSNDNNHNNNNQNPAPFAPRGKNSAMLRRLRSRDSNDDDPVREAIHRAVPFAAAAAHRDIADNGNDERDDGGERGPLTRLVQRLRREYATNFCSSRNGNFSLRPSDLDRARYLLEATSGNVGLASWLYWEDYLTSNAADPGGGGAWNRMAMAGSAGEFNVHHPHDNRDPETSSVVRGEELKRSGIEAQELKRKREGNDNMAEEEHENDDDDDDDRKPPSKKSKMSSDELRCHALRMARAKFHMDAATINNNNNNNSNNRENANSNSPAPADEARTDNPPPNPPENPPPHLDATSPNVSRTHAELRLEAPPPPPAANRRRWLHHPLDQLQLLERQDSNHLHDNNNNNAHLPRVDLMNLESFLLELYRQQPPRNNGEDAPSAHARHPLGLPMPPAGAIHPRISDALSRMLQGRPLDEEETRALLRALGEPAAPAAPSGGVAAGDGDGDGDPDDDEEDEEDDDDSDNGSENNGDDLDENDSRSRESENDDNASFDWNEPFVNMMEEASPRRSGRSRAQRHRRARGENVPAAVAAAAQPWARNDGGASISDDDNEIFVPVFREMARIRRGDVKSCAGKSKKGDELDVAANDLFEGKNNDDSSVISDDSTIDITEFFNPGDKSLCPMDILWAKTGGENDESSDDEEMRTVIPSTWLRTGFVLSESGNGLAVASPSDEEWDIVRRSHPQIIRDGPLKSIKGLFPYHCKGLSALLSIVTAMLYSGASIRGSTVTCDADVTPFDELTPEQRKEEFPKRLVEALSALIFIAAQAMSVRCANALAAMDRRHARRRKKHVLTQEEEDEFTASRLKMQRRVGQCRVCSWEPDTANNDAPRFPQGRDPKDIRVHSSLTNIQDIRSYVKSHLRAFTEPGGCALLLETIARCHGTTYFERLFDSHERGDKESDESKVVLVGCKCKETVRYLERRSKDKNLPEGMPDEHDCIRVELLSLLLTGQARSNYQNWDADNLGIGLLRIDKESVVGSRLLRPLKPIWVCLGDFGYSTLFLDKKDFIGNEKSLDEPGKVFTLAHWDCWGGERTTMTVIPCLYDCPSTRNSLPAVISDMEEDSKRTVTQSIAIRIEEERRRDSGNPWGSSDLYHGSSRNHELDPITDAELQCIKFHPEDEKFYPKEYRRWRYSFGNDDNWISFYRLRGRQKLQVEMKLAPRICVLVRTRWPLATVRDFSPANKFPIV